MPSLGLLKYDRHLSVCFAAAIQWKRCSTYSICPHLSCGNARKYRMCATSSSSRRHCRRHGGQCCAGCLLDACTMQALCENITACTAGFGVTPTASSASSPAPFSASFGLSASTAAQSAPQSTPALFGTPPTSAQPAPAFGIASSSGQSMPALAFGQTAPAVSLAPPVFGQPAASSATPAPSLGQPAVAAGQSGGSFGSFGFGASSAAAAGSAGGARSFPARDCSDFPMQSSSSTSSFICARTADLTARLNAELNCIIISGLCGHTVDYTAATWRLQVPQMQYHRLGFPAPHLLQLQPVPFNSQVRPQAHRPVQVQQAAHQAHLFFLWQSALPYPLSLLPLQRPFLSILGLQLHLALLQRLPPLRLQHTW